jgi:SAM-dependent methyltransferase
MPVSKDIIGLACQDYFQQPDESLHIEVWSDVADTEQMPVQHLFRDYKHMPALEQTALQLCRGRVLDMGAGAGPHALWLQEKGMEVWAAEISPAACEVMRARGVKNVVNADLFDLQLPQRFDTILMLMNGIGIVGQVDRLKNFFDLARRLLAPGGQLILDSTDLRYLFLEDDGSFLVNLNDRYYGEVIYRMIYNGQKGRRFPWLFIDDQLLEYYANLNHFHFEKLATGPHFDYLARLTLMP